MWMAMGSNDFLNFQTFSNQKILDTFLTFENFISDIFFVFRHVVLESQQVRVCCNIQCICPAFGKDPDLNTNNFF